MFFPRFHEDTPQLTLKSHRPFYKDTGHKKEQPGNPGCGFKLNKVEAFSLSGKLIRIWHQTKSAAGKGKNRNILSTLKNIRMLQNETATTERNASIQDKSQKNFLRSHLTARDLWGNLSRFPSEVTGVQPNVKVQALMFVVAIRDFHQISFRRRNVLILDCCYTSTLVWKCKFDGLFCCAVLVSVVFVGARGAFELILIERYSITN